MRYYLERSPDCPTGKSAIDEETYLFIHDSEILDRRMGTMGSSAIANVRAVERDMYRLSHSASEELGALGCKKVIAEGNCPFWVFDPATNSYLDK